MASRSSSYNPDHYTTKLQQTRFVGCDLDGTLAEEVWQHSQGIGKPIAKNIKKLQEVVRAGYKVCIFTARGDVEQENIKRWCRDHNIPVHKIITGKPLFAFVIDDKNVNARDRQWLPKWLHG